MQKINAEEYLKGSDESAFSTGFSDVDDFMGKVDKGSIITVGARPSMGKTSFALSILLHLADENRKVIWFSPSMSMKAVIRRITANYLDVLPFELERNPKYEGKIKAALEHFSEKNLFIDDTAEPTVEYIGEQIKENTPDVVFIDYIQLLKMPKAPNFTDSINLAVQEIQRIARETGVVFVLLTQLSRSVESRPDHRPMLCDIRNSSMLEELSDVVIMLYRDEYYNRDNIDSSHTAEIIFCKNNSGPTGLADLLFYNGRFKNRLRTETF